MTKEEVDEQTKDVPCQVKFFPSPVLLFRIITWMHYDIAVKFCKKKKQDDLILFFFVEQGGHWVLGRPGLQIQSCFIISSHRPHLETPQKNILQMKYQILFNASTPAKNSMNIFFKHKRCQDLLRTQRATSKIGVWTWAMAAELAQRFSNIFRINRKVVLKICKMHLGSSC